MNLSRKLIKEEDNKPENINISKLNRNIKIHKKYDLQNNNHFTNGFSCKDTNELSKESSYICTDDKRDRKILNAQQKSTDKENLTKKLYKNNQPITKNAYYDYYEHLNTLNSEEKDYKNICEPVNFEKEINVCYSEKLSKKDNKSNEIKVNTDEYDFDVNEYTSKKAFKLKNSFNNDNACIQKSYQRRNEFKEDIILEDVDSVITKNNNKYGDFNSKTKELYNNLKQTNYDNFINTVIIKGKLHEDTKEKNTQIFMMHQQNSLSFYGEKNNNIICNNKKNNYDEFIIDSNNKNIDILQKQHHKNLQDFEQKQYYMNLDQIILNNILLKLENQIYFYDNDEGKLPDENHENKNVYACCDLKNLDFYSFANHIEKYHPKELNKKNTNNENFKKEKLFVIDRIQLKALATSTKKENQENSQNVAKDLTEKEDRIINTNERSQSSITKNKINYKDSFITNYVEDCDNKNYTTQKVNDEIKFQKIGVSNDDIYMYKKENDLHLLDLHLQKNKRNTDIYKQKQHEEIALRNNKNPQCVDKKFKCDKLSCKRVFTSKAGFLYHVEHGHKFNQFVVKPYVCTVKGCNKRYKNQNGLKYHLEHGH